VNENRGFQTTGTCIVGLRTETAVYIGGDSQGVDGWLGRAIRVDEKVFRKGRMIFGFTSSFRMGQILRYSFSPPSQKVDEDDYKYLCGAWVDSLISCLKDKGYAKVENNVSTGGTFLLGFNGRLYRIESDFQIAERVEPYDAIGCALSILTEKRIRPEAMVKRALEAAEQFSAGVAGPFVIEKLERGGSKDG